MRTAKSLWNPETRQDFYAKQECEKTIAKGQTCDVDAKLKKNNNKKSDRSIR
jgi:hypothetical protein